MENYTKPKKWYELSERPTQRGSETSPQPLVNHFSTREDFDGTLIKPINIYDKIAREYD